MEDSRRVAARRGGKQLVLILCAGSSLAVIACLAVSWERIIVFYHVHRLKTGKETLRGMLARDPTPIEAASVDAFLETSRGLEAIARTLVEEVDRAGMSFCDSGRISAATRVLLWLDPNGHLRLDVVCDDSTHFIVDQGGEDPTFRRRLRPFLSRAPRVEPRELEESRMIVSLLPFEEGAATFFHGQGIHPDKTPRPSQGAGTMALFLEKVDRPSTGR